MWKRTVAICCIPVAAALSLGLLFVMVRSLFFRQQGSVGVEAASGLGALAGLALLGFPVFLLWRWILRTLTNGPRTPPAGPANN